MCFVLFDLRAFKADAASADSRFEFRPELVHLAFVYGDRERKLKFLKRQPMSPAIETALQAPFKDFVASKYKLVDKPQDF